MQADIRPFSAILHDLGHSFSQQSVFSGISSTIKPGTECLVRGANGSGKSTLGAILVGEVSPEQGTIEWREGNQTVLLERVLFATARVSPNTALHPDLSIRELIQFQGQFRNWKTGVDPVHWLKTCGLSGKTLEKRWGHYVLQGSP